MTFPKNSLVLSFVVALAATDVSASEIFHRIDADAPDRAAIMDAMRPTYEKTFGAPIAFKVVSTMLVGRFAFVTAHPMRPDGQNIDVATWRRATRNGCEQQLKDFEDEIILEKKDVGWSVRQTRGYCGDDSIIDTFYKMSGLTGDRDKQIESVSWRLDASACVSHASFAFAKVTLALEKDGKVRLRAETNFDKKSRDYTPGFWDIAKLATYEGKPIDGHETTGAVEFASSDAARLALKKSRAIGWSSKDGGVLGNTETADIERALLALKDKCPAEASR